MAGSYVLFTCDCKLEEPHHVLEPSVGSSTSITLFHTSHFITPGSRRKVLWEEQGGSRVQTFQEASLQIQPAVNGQLFRRQNQNTVAWNNQFSCLILPRIGSSPK